MIIDTDQVDGPQLLGNYHTCIVGAGVAGIVLARSLAVRGLRVLLLEAGGLDYTDESQDIYKGANAGRGYFDLDSARLRFLGGTSNHWSGMCRPLDDHDFEAFEHLPGSGWPIGASDLEPYLDETRTILELADFPPDEALVGADGGLKRVWFRFSNSGSTLWNQPPVRMQDKYLEDLKLSRMIDVFLNANLVRIDIDSDTGRVSRVVFRGYREGRPDFAASAGRYVLAMGAIENARALLNANHQRVAGLGNDGDLVGRYFMEHLHHSIGFFVTTADHTEFGSEPLFLSPTRALIEREGISNCGLRFAILKHRDGLAANVESLARQSLCASEIIADLARSVRFFRCPANPLVAGGLRVASEQAPNPDSRVLLTNDLDRFGQRRIALDWRISPIDKKTMRAVGLEAGRYFARANIGRIKLYDWLLDEGDFVPGLDEGEATAGYHHMGTTRMGSSPADGVVDRNCRLFDVANLYVAGSSVFRTCGHANPTMSIVQLTLRLAEHLATT